jgi:uncharacterized protein YcgI (DUF1989 family)
LIATIRLTEAQLDLAKREITRRLPGAELTEGLVAIATEQLAEELAAPPPRAPAPSGLAATPDPAAPTPPTLAAPRLDIEVGPGAGVGAVVGRGECVRVEQVGDGQGADLIAYDIADTRGRVSAARSRMFAGTRPTVGDDLWSGAPVEAPLLTIVADSCPSHDLTFPACSRFEYEHYAGLADHANCFDVQAEVVRAWGLQPSEIPDPLNLWLPTRIGPSGQLRSEPTTARRGDHIDLLAQRDVLVVVCPCPDDIFGTSRWEPKPIRVLVAPTPSTAAPPDPAFHVARPFPAPAMHEISVDIPDEVLPQLGPDAPETLRGLFFRAWLQRAS